MLPRQITHQNILRVLLAGFTLVIVLLVAAASSAFAVFNRFRRMPTTWCAKQSLTNR
jgi:hypothetical protein